VRRMTWRTTSGRPCVVVLYGLPAVAAGAILAHECTHAHIRLDGGYPRLEPKVEAGLDRIVTRVVDEDDVASTCTPCGG